MRRLALISLVVLAIVIALVWLAQRGLRAARADLQHLISQEVLALQIGQRELFLALLDSADTSWLRYHRENFTQEAAWYAGRPKARPRIESLRLQPNEAIVGVVLQDGRQAWRATWFFRRIKGRWRHAPPSTDPAATTSINTRHLSLVVLAPDRGLAARLAPGLEALYLALARDYHPQGGAAPATPAPERVALQLVPSSAGSVDTSLLASTLSLEMQSAEEYSTRLGRAARLNLVQAVLLRAMKQAQPRTGDWWLVESLALWHARAWQPDWRASLQASLADGSYKRLLTIQSAGRGSSQSRQLRSLPSDLDWARPLAYTMGEFLAASYSAEQLSALIGTIEESGSSWAAVQKVLGLSQSQLETAWTAFLKQHYGAP